MNLEAKVREIVQRNMGTIEGSEGGEIESRIVDDIVNDLMEMLRKGAYV